MLENLETAYKNRNKIKVLILSKEEKTKGSLEKIIDSHIVFIKKDKKFYVYKNKLSNNFEDVSEKYVNEIRQSNDYIVEEL